MAFPGELIRVVQRLSFCRDADAVMSVLREAARDLTGADGVTIVFRDEDMCYYAEENAIAPLWKGRHFPMTACISGWCMLHREQLTIPDIYADDRIPHDAYRPTFVKSLAMTPIRSEEPIGAIGAYWASHHEATAEELEVLQALGDAASTAIANVELINALKDASRRRDEFISMLAHELRNPLAPIRNALHVLQLRSDDGATVRRAQEVMDRQVQHLAQIVDDLLDVARITRGKLELRRERLDLGRTVRQCVEDHRGVLEAAGLAVQVCVPEMPVWVEGDATRLAQALGSVLENAAKFTPAGGEVAVRLSTDDPDGRAVLTVRDTGIGIEPEMLPHIFETFSQADRSLDRPTGGLGLGLSVARGVLELHGGTIEAASDGMGQGSTFTLRLPREQELPALAREASAQSPAGQEQRILVVEDNRDSAETLRMLLEVCGYNVTVAYTGTDGLAAAQAVLPHAVLCDIGLPGMDGFDVAAALKRDPKTAGARLIAVTGYGDEEDRQRALAAGFDAHMVKPVDPDKLLMQLAPTGAA